MPGKQTTASPASPTTGPTFANAAGSASAPGPRLPRTLWDVSRTCRGRVADVSRRPEGGACLVDAGRQERDAALAARRSGLARRVQHVVAQRRRPRLCRRLEHEESSRLGEQQRRWRGGDPQPRRRGLGEGPRVERERSADRKALLLRRWRRRQPVVSLRRADAAGERSRALAQLRGAGGVALGAVDGERHRVPSVEIRLHFRVNGEARLAWRRRNRIDGVGFLHIPAPDPKKEIRPAFPRGGARAGAAGVRDVRGPESDVRVSALRLFS